MKKGLTFDEVVNLVEEEGQLAKGISGWFCVVFKDGENYAFEEYIRGVSNWHLLDKWIADVGLPVICTFGLPHGVAFIRHKIRENQ